MLSCPVGAADFSSQEGPSHPGAAVGLRGNVES